ncbi:hypothetical protein ASD50_07535 [Mesorhizobium sp. Root552]|jgi:hypothetical protein|uniref:hypothetical protein n=1 Tax=Mesorhizobium sp. Root552 TaxID=1736555 RepID=UPI0006F40F42|nr:hypothetical protein [Mesorhizobium sp. Root552]KQZ19329.1 hypothetical protein ASD50_07535 [Mesorhizobium sp. Root552]
MSLLASYAEMDADDIRTCSRQAQALLRLFQAAVGGVRSNRVPYEDAIEPIEEAAELCLELMERVHEAVASLTKETIEQEGAAQ